MVLMLINQRRITFPYPANFSNNKMWQKQSEKSERLVFFPWYFWSFFRAEKQKKESNFVYYKAPNCVFLLSVSLSFHSALKFPSFFLFLLKHWSGGTARKCAVKYQMFVIFSGFWNLNKKRKMIQYISLSKFYFMYHVKLITTLLKRCRYRRKI